MNASCTYGMLFMSKSFVSAGCARHKHYTKRRCKHGHRITWTCFYKLFYGTCHKVCRWTARKVHCRHGVVRRQILRLNDGRYKVIDWILYKERCKCLTKTRVRYIPWSESLIIPLDFQLNLHLNKNNMHFYRMPKARRRAQKMHCWNSLCEGQVLHFGGIPLHSSRHSRSSQSWSVKPSLSNTRC